MLPGGPRNERQMQMMMKRLGLTTEPLGDVEEVIVRMRDREHVFKDPEVTILTIQGVRTYQVVGTPTVRARPSKSESTPVSAPATPAGPPEEDVKLVMEQSGVDRAAAVRALVETGGEPAEAILHLLAQRGQGGV
ncbi:MAG: nascent polypeptide-associated complex protein [Thermoplasmata archaeon]